MATIAVGTAGTKLQMGDTDVGTFTDIEQVYELSGPNETSADIEVTNFDSTGKEFIAGLSDGGEVTFSYIINPDSTSQAALRVAKAARAVKYFKLIWNDATAVLVIPSKTTFAAAITGIGQTASTDDVFRANATLKVSGAVTFTKRSAT